MKPLYITFTSKFLSNVINYFQVYHIYTANKVNPVHRKVKLNRQTASELQTTCSSAIYWNELCALCHMKNVVQGGV
jgi:hypothetical protein